MWLQHCQIITAQYLLHVRRLVTVLSDAAHLPACDKCLYQLSSEVMYMHALSFV